MTTESQIIWYEVEMIACHTDSMENLWRPETNDGSRHIVTTIFRLMGCDLSKLGIWCWLGNHAHMHMRKFPTNLDRAEKIFPIIIRLNPFFQFLVCHLKALAENDLWLMRYYCCVRNKGIWWHFYNFRLLSWAFGLISLAIQDNQFPINGIQGSQTKVTMLK